MFPNYWPYVIVMALVTYLVRVIPLTLMQKEITNEFFLSFLYYVPFACLAAMVFPAILSSTTYLVSAAVGLAVAVIMAYFEKSLITVALTACAAVFICERIIEMAL
ncbi:MAG: AzlD domain-containing protein [Eubacterium sp.]|nr:AzlD domain-containing protein [Eubacterium sp.]